MRFETREFTTPSNKKINATLLVSPYHVEINPSDVGMYDRLIVQELIKEIAQTQQVDVNAPRAFKGTVSS